MKILVTGAAGFIASHLIEELLEDKNNSIIGIDNFYSGTKKNLEFLNSIDKNKKFKFIQADVRNFDEICKIIKDYKIVQVYHLAAIASVEKSVQNPLLSNEVNVNGTLNVLEASRLNSVKRVLFSSSAAVYGNESTQPKNESSLTCPVSPYGYHKLMSEQYMKLYSNLYSLETVVLRYFNVYGERQSILSDYSGVISIFENKLKKNQVPNIYGDGNQYRDFIYVKDVVKANIIAMNFPNISGEIFCLGTAQKVSINELFCILKIKFNKFYDANYLKAKEGDILESICDNSKIKDVLGLKEFKKFEHEILTF